MIAVACSILLAGGAATSVVALGVLTAAAVASALWLRSGGEPASRARAVLVAVLTVYVLTFIGGAAVVGVFRLFDAVSPWMTVYVLLAPLFAVVIAALVVRKGSASWVALVVAWAVAVAAIVSAEGIAFWFTDLLGRDAIAAVTILYAPAGACALFFGLMVSVRALENRVKVRAEEPA